MPATYNAESLFSRSERRMVDYDIDNAANLVVLDPASGDKCLSVSQFRRFAAGLFRSVGTGTVDGFRIVAATSAAGAGAVTVVAHAVGSAPDAVGDRIWLECDAAQIKEVLAAATHVGVEIDLATTTDECVVFFERADPLYSRHGLTADFIA